MTDAIQRELQFLRGLVSERQADIPPWLALEWIDSAIQRIDKDIACVARETTAEVPYLDSVRLEWIFRHISGAEWRRLGIITSAGMNRTLLNDAMVAAESADDAADEIERLRAKRDAYKAQASANRQAIEDFQRMVTSDIHETTCDGSGDPSNCPENEGRGCCRPNPEKPVVWRNMINSACATGEQRYAELTGHYPMCGVGEGTQNEPCSCKERLAQKTSDDPK